jgi:hypothetical protein
VDLPRQQKLPYRLWPAVITGVHAGAAAIGRTADRGGRAGAALVRELSAMRVEISESGREGPACDLCGPGELPFVLIGPRLAARGRSRRGSATQAKPPAKPPAPPSRINSLRRRWGRHSACRDFYRGLLEAGSRTWVRPKPDLQMPYKRS